MGKKRRKLDGQKLMRQSTPQPESPVATKTLERMDEMERRISAEMAELRKTVKRGSIGMVVFSRMICFMFLPIRAVLWVIGSVFHPIASAKILRDWLYIRKSGMFNTFFYLTEYPDVMATATPPIFHYCTRGWRELRDPRPDFSTAGYLGRNADIKSCGMNPFYHYVRYRKVEPFREGTAKPLDQGETGMALSRAQVELARVPAPLTGSTLGDRTMEAIATRVKEGLHADT